MYNVMISSGHLGGIGGGFWFGFRDNLRDDRRDHLRFNVTAARALMRVVVSSMGLAVMKSTAEEAHAAKAADTDFLADLFRGRLSGRFSRPHIGIDLGEETADERGTLVVFPRGTNREHVNDV